uniref:Rubicon like autophagy enhancer n=1 Tax=Amphilophus citrinellus TaxID=61819 RepID=A0A3Q0R888_AMPCI
MSNIYLTFISCVQENAHFIVVDMVLEMLESAKWTLSLDQWLSTMDTHHDTHCQMCRHTSSAQDSSPHKQTCKAQRRAGDCSTDDPGQQKETLKPLWNLDMTADVLSSSLAVSSSSLTEEIRQRTRMRGSLNWAPPRFQIIFTVQPTLRFPLHVVALQHFLCAGCGTEVEPSESCITYCEWIIDLNSEAVIPGRVLSCWDFGRYPVSDFSKQLLDSVWHQPLFDLTCVGKTLYGKVKELDRFRELEDQLLGIKKLLTACRLSGSVLTELEDFPAHLREQPNLFSMDDLQKLKKGQLAAQTKAVLHSAIAHVENCELCLARGFICEFCREKDVIFPFQSDICKRCPVCKACFHKKCFVEKKCPKCTRIQARKNHWDGSMKSNT